MKTQTKTQTGQALESTGEKMSAEEIKRRALWEKIQEVKKDPEVVQAIVSSHIGNWIGKYDHNNSDLVAHEIFGSNFERKADKQNRSIILRFSSFEMSVFHRAIQNYMVLITKDCNRDGVDRHEFVNMTHLYPKVKYASERCYSE